VLFLAVHFDSAHRPGPMSSRLLFTMSGTMAAPVFVVYLGRCPAPYLVEIGHGVIAQKGVFRCLFRRHFAALISPVADNPETSLRGLPLARTVDSSPWVVVRSAIH